MNNLATSFRLHYASHSWLIAVSVTALILSVFECVEISSPNPFYWILDSCYMLTILVLPAWPRQGSWLMLAISYLLPLFEGPRYPAILLGEIIALSVLAYYAKVWESILALLSAFLAQSLVADFLHPVDVFSWFVFVALCGSGLLLGYVFREKSRREEAEKRQAQEELAIARLQLVEARNKLALRIHDSLTNNLSDISLIAHEHTEDSLTENPDSDVSDWRTVSERTEDSFKQIHTIIDLLSQDPQTRQNPQTGQGLWEAEISSLVTRLREHHDQRGQRGHVSLKIADGLDLQQKISPEVQEETLSLLTEIFANLQRHAPSGDDSYDLFVQIGPERILIRQTNDLSNPGTRPLPEAERSGRGLGMHQAIVEKLGGTMRTRLQDGHWLIYVSLPVS
ncbi:sensor histidine kinase [Parascardovia denticolens]|uniref:sensor histidine kinase n=1 Tax=Parascardovia denticolens TaxID=78258 RepID=UPI00248E0DBD|nr:histidine kinase [Parascardovia denticolens]